MKDRTTERVQADFMLRERVRDRLNANGLEANRLRALLYTALIDAAHLVGDKDEAAELNLQLAALQREIWSSTSRGS